MEVTDALAKAPVFVRPPGRSFAQFAKDSRDYLLK